MLRGGDGRCYVTGNIARCRSSRSGEASRSPMLLLRGLRSCWSLCGPCSHKYLQQRYQPACILYRTQLLHAFLELVYYVIFSFWERSSSIISCWPEWNRINENSREVLEVFLNAYGTSRRFQGQDFSFLLHHVICCRAKLPVVSARSLVNITSFGLTYDYVRGGSQSFYSKYGS
jgi:hypothetical protein